MTLGEAARALSVTRSALYGRIARGTLKTKPRGNRGLLVWLPDGAAHAEHHGDEAPDVMVMVELAELRAEVAELRVALARAEVERNAARREAEIEREKAQAVAAAEVSAAKREVEALGRALEREQARGDRLEAELRRPWWVRLVGRR